MLELLRLQYCIYTPNPFHFRELLRKASKGVPLGANLYNRKAFLTGKTYAKGVITLELLSVPRNSN